MDKELSVDNVVKIAYGMPSQSDCPWKKTDRQRKEALRGNHFLTKQTRASFIGQILLRSSGPRSTSLSRSVFRVLWGKNKTKQVFRASWLHDIAKLHKISPNIIHLYAELLLKENLKCMSLVFCFVLRSAVFVWERAQLTKGAPLFCVWGRL